MTQSLAALDSLFFNIVLATLAIGLPILVVLSIRFLWDRNLNLAVRKNLKSSSGSCTASPAQWSIK